MAKKMDPIVRQEAAFVAVCVLAACVITQGVCIMVEGWWTLPVLWGSLLGGVTAIGNFLLMCLTVLKALEHDPKKAAQTIKLSQSGRMLLQGAMLILAGVLPCFNLWAAIVPLIIPTFAVRVRHWIVAKNNPSPDRPAIGWADVDEEEELMEEEAD